MFFQIFSINLLFYIPSIMSSSKVISHGLPPLPFGPLHNLFFQHSPSKVVSHGLPPVPHVLPLNHRYPLPQQPQGLLLSDGLSLTHRHPQPQAQPLPNGLPLPLSPAEVPNMVISHSLPILSSGPLMLNSAHPQPNLSLEDEHNSNVINVQPSLQYNDDPYEAQNYVSNKYLRLLTIFLNP